MPAVTQLSKLVKEKLQKIDKNNININIKII